MSDFYQTGVVATLHRLGRANGHKIEAEPQVFGKQRPRSGECEYGCLKSGSNVIASLGASMSWTLSRSPIRRRLRKR
jgi:hypothetical protein